MLCQMRTSFVANISTIISIVVLMCGHTLTPVYGMCPRGCDCDDIKLRTVCESEAPDLKLDYIPHTLNPALKELVLLDNHIRGIKSSLYVYRNLQTLDISRNELTSLGEQNFVENTRIETIVANTNRLTQIQNKTFNGLTALRNLYLKENRLEALDANVFRPLSSLESLDLSRNQIAFISVDAFRGLQSLIKLNLRSNQLNAIPSNALQFVPKLNFLDLGSNSILNISNDAFPQLSSLTELCLDDCALYAIESESFRGLTELLVLRLQNNDLETIPSKALSELVGLEELQIGRNNLRTLPTKVFSSLKNLKALEINGTETLSAIELGAFEGLPHLERLELSDNKLLKRMDANVLSAVPNLRYLTLRSNAFQTLRLDFVNSIDRNIILDVRDNPFHCNCSLEWLRSYLLQTNTSAKHTDNDSSQQFSYSFNDWLVSVSRVHCESPPALNSKLIVDLDAEDIGCYQLDTTVPIIIAILIGVLVISGVIIIFVIRCKYGLTGLVKNQWFSADNSGANSDCVRNDLNYRKPEFVFIPNIDLNIDETNRALEEAVRYPLKMTPITEL